MESEIEKDPSSIDSNKITQINLLLDKLENRDELPNSLRKDVFFKEFDDKYNMVAPNTGDCNIFCVN